MSQTLTKLQNQALIGILDNPVISKRVGGDLKRFAGLMALSVAMLAASGAADARNRTGNKISAVLGSGAALMYLGNSGSNNPSSLDGAKIMGGAALGSVVGSQLGNGKGGAAIAGAVIGGVLVNGSIQQRKQEEAINAQRMNNNGYAYDSRYGGPPPGAPYSRYPANHTGPYENGVYNNGYNNNNIRQPSSLALYMVRGQQGFFVSLDNSPSVAQMRSGQMNGMPLGQNPQLAQELNNKFQTYAQRYQELEQANQNFENYTVNQRHNNNGNYYQQTSYSEYNNQNNYNRGQDIQNASQYLSRAVDAYSNARGEFFLSADNAAFAGYSVANYREALNIVQPSQRVSVSLNGNNKYPIVNQNRANFIIR